MGLFRLFGLSLFTFSPGACEAMDLRMSAAELDFAMAILRTATRALLEMHYVRAARFWETRQRKKTEIRFDLA